jgi:hypothetical protein
MASSPGQSSCLNSPILQVANCLQKLWEQMLFCEALENWIAVFLCVVQIVPAVKELISIPNFNTY